MSKLVQTHMIGRVVSTKMNKSAVVLVESNKKHPLYGKIFLRTKKYTVDDQLGAKLGDIVEITKIKPVSKNKHFKISKILGQDVVALGEEAMKEKAAQAIEEVLPEKEEPPSSKATGDKESKPTKVAEVAKEKETKVKSTGKKLKVEKEVKT